ncbi:MAG: hypothetical protein NVSMB24_03880 [Mucilaginibacter sp.]
MGAIYNFHKVSGLLACAGQPREEQLQDIANDGYKVVINLGLSDGKYALKDESEVGSRRSEVGGQKSEVRSREVGKSEVLSNT